jgi:hypothetical protein
MKRPFRLYRLLFLLALLCTVASAQPQPASAPLFITGPALSVNAAANQHAISPYIYGMNFAPQNLANELQLPVNRWGGNTMTRYNWQNNLANHASDFYFENIPEDITADQFITNTTSIGTHTLMTIPLIGWIPKDQSSPPYAYDCGFSTTKYSYIPGPLYPGDPGYDTYNPDSAECGTGKRSNGTYVTGNDPTDTSIAVDSTFMGTWVQHFVDTFGSAADGGVLFYDLDNEPGLWHETHRDVHPDHLLYQELVDLTYDYAAAIKAVDAGAQILGPVQDGWARYFYASYTDDPDTVAQNDRDNHGGKPFVQWYLEQLKNYADTHSGARLLDYFDLHYYPQAPGVSLSPAGNSTTQALRLRSTRSLWDPTYVDESWIKDTEEGNMAVQLIPRMQDWVDTYYPGTKLAISEYNWGALDHINGALAQADVLGIFGREGLDLATLWDPPTSTQPGAYAFRMYLNYDDNGSTFGDTSVLATSADQSQLSIYAATRSGDGALTLMVINKTGNSLTSNVTLANFTPFLTAQGYRYTGGTSISSFSQSVGPTGFSATFNANSITLLVLSPNGGTTATPTSTPTRTNTPVPPTMTLTPTNTPVPPGPYQAYLPSLMR